MKSVYAWPWFLLSLGVIVWRGIYGWQTYTHIGMIAIASLGMLIVGNGLAGLPLIDVVIRSIGGATLLSASYWAFFEKDPKARLNAVDHSRARLLTILLLATLVLQIPLALIRLTEVGETALFYGLYAFYAALLGVLGLLALMSLGQRRRAGADLNNIRE
jgi:hypothetical protein